MTTMKKIAVCEVAISLTAALVVSALLPVSGDAATAGFGILGLLGVVPVLLMKHAGMRVIADERDREIEQRSLKIGMETAWMMLFLSMITIVLWFNLNRQSEVPVRLLNWLIWIQFTICYAVKGSAALMIYRRQEHAAKI